MSPLSLFSGNGKNSPEKVGEFLRLPENDFGTRTMLSRVFSTSKAVDHLGRLELVHPDPSDSGSIVQAQRAPELFTKGDSVYDKATGRVGNGMVSADPVVRPVLNSSIDSDPYSLDRLRARVAGSALSSIEMQAHVPNDVVEAIQPHLEDPSRGT